VERRRKTTNLPPAMIPKMWKWRHLRKTTPRQGCIRGKVILKDRKIGYFSDPWSSVANSTSSIYQYSQILLATTCTCSQGPSNHASANLIDCDDNFFTVTSSLGKS